MAAIRLRLMSDELANRVEGVYCKCSELRERANGDGTFTIDGAKMMALIELRNLAPELVLALGKGS